jgi:hypothetical protein
LRDDQYVEKGLPRLEPLDASHEILFTAEDIKDVLSSTGLWLAVRESFGGLGRTKRKGDGWHLRP